VTHPGELGDGVVDGSVSEGNDARLSGYSVVRANDLDSAVAMARGCPVPAGGGSVVVSETVDM